MGEYGPGHTIGSAAELDKERVRHALHGELVFGEDESGFVYLQATKEACDTYILGVIDNLVYQCKELAASGRAMERILDEHGGMASNFKKYMAYRAEEDMKFQGDYLYESDLAELQDEADEIARGGQA